MKKFVLLLVILIIGCTSDVILPEDELKLDDTKLGHDSWSKVVVVVTEGELIKGVFNGYKNQANLKIKTVQEVSFNIEGMEVKHKGETISLVKGNYYGLEIKYYNKAGRLMNNQFATAAMAPIHQHFFISSENNTSLKQTKKYTIDYIYRDTNPIDKSIADSNTKLRENDPIGLKGYFKVIKEASYSFDMNIILVHILGRSKFDSNGESRPFYSPTTHMIGVTDFYQKIPMKIFADKKSTTFLTDVANEFKITKKQVEEELKKREIGSLRL